MDIRVAWLLMLGLIFCPSSSFGEEPDHAERDHQMARIFETRVYPKTIEIHSDDAIAWLNYSGKTARISFDGEVARNMTCRSIVAFRHDGRRLTTRDIQERQFAAFCSLAPGEYEYRVELRSESGGPGSSSFDKSFTGKIIVSK